MKSNEILATLTATQSLKRAFALVEAMITIRKKLAEQAAAASSQTQRKSDGKELKRRQSIRTQLLTSGKFSMVAVPLPFVLLYLHFLYRS